MYVLESYNCINRNCKTVRSSSMLILTEHRFIFIWLVTASIRYNLLPTKDVPNKPKWLNIIHLVLLSDPLAMGDSELRKILIEPEPHHCHNKNLTLTLYPVYFMYSPFSRHHAGKSFLRSWQPFNWSRNYLPFIGTKRSLPHSQETWASWIQFTSSYLFNIYCSNILPSMPRSGKLFFLMGVFDYFFYTFLTFHMMVLYVHPFLTFNIGDTSKKKGKLGCWWQTVQMKIHFRNNGVFLFLRLMLSYLIL